MEGKGRALIRKARVVEMLTFLVVILITPVSMVFVIPFGVSPQDWVNAWDKYVFLLILLAIGLSVVGFGLSTNYRLEADRIEKKGP
jgi:drug/metabolite transporter (DMT)-like permease